MFRPLMKGKLNNVFTILNEKYCKILLLELNIKMFLNAINKDIERYERIPELLVIRKKKNE